MHEVTRVRVLVSVWDYHHRQSHQKSAKHLCQKVCGLRDSSSMIRALDLLGRYDQSDTGSSLSTGNMCEPYMKLADEP